MRKAFVGIALSIVLTGALRAHSQEGQWYEFQVGVLGVSQAGGLYDPFSVDFHWTPSLSHGTFTVRGDLGFAVLNGTASGTSARDKFASFSYQAFAEFVLVHNLVGAVGGGVQSWLDHESLKPIISTQLALLVVEAPLISRVAIGASRFFASYPSWQWNFGVGLRFD